MAERRSVLQDWVEKLTFMQQSVLISAVRGPDGIKKDHVAKLILRWFRRCILVSAFEGGVLMTPLDGGGGSFTGPSLQSKTVAVSGLGIERVPDKVDWPLRMDDLLTDYLRTVDELPHHYQLHLLHASEIVGYKHSDPKIRAWWFHAYLRLVNDLHLLPESESLVDKRLGDNEAGWRAREEVTAAGPVS